MLKKIILLYSSLMFVMLFALMSLLITVTLIDISEDKKTKISNNDLITLNDLSEEAQTKDNLKISTDKNVYTSRENVLITFENLGQSKIAQKGNSSLTTKCRHDIGDNYGIAFIEHKKGDDWIAIEPVNRCSDDCSKACSSNREINAKTETSFVWPQTVLQCTGENNSNTNLAPLGTYRISSATWNKETSTFVRIHSNIFKISSISKK